MVGEAEWGPQNCKFTQEHEWVRLEPNGLARVGISDYAATELGDVVYVALPEVEAQVEQFQKFGEIESVKAVSDLFSPISGEVVATNLEVVYHPELVNQSPFGMGWMVQVRPRDLTELDKLMSEQEYQVYLWALAEQAKEED